MNEARQDKHEWSRYPDAIALAQRELPAYCAAQRWYPAKDADAPAMSLDVVLPLNGSVPDAALAVWKFTVEGHEPFAAFVPLAVVSTEGLARINRASIGNLPDGHVVIDATESDAFVKGLVQLMLEEVRLPCSNLQSGHTEHIAALRERPLSQWRIERSAVEQSNTSIRIADKSILKVLRKIAPGIHPELEMARFLTEVARFRATPALLGWINLEECTIAILQEFIPNEGDGWTWIRKQLQAGEAGANKASGWIGRVGEITAEMHAALDAPSAEPAFRSETARPEDWQRWAQELSAMVGRVKQALLTSRSHLDEEAELLAHAFDESAGALDEWLASLVTLSPAWRKTRHHGDYHLAQVLVSGENAVIVDFEGEPMRSLEDRRAKHVPLRDVAGMLRSIQYVSATLQRDIPAGWSAEAQSKELMRLNVWAAEASRAFVERYLQRLQHESSLPIDTAAANRIIQFFLLEKALYEVLYELSNRPTWACVPLRYLVEQLRQMTAPRDALDRVTRQHRMPFGAEIQARGGVRFRLWAPHCAQVAVAIRSADIGQERTVKMTPLAQGWHELFDAESGAGTLYEYVLPDGSRVPDPASRFQPRDVPGPSEVIDPCGYAWSESWQGRDWSQAVIYELHVGTFTPQGTFRAAVEHLDHLAALGVSAIELMPIADFPGRRNWGYDGVLWYAPDSTYGRPEDLKFLIEAAHSRGMMVLLDVVYNHFGPDGNFLPSFAPGFFNDRHQTPWGAAVNYDGPDSNIVREFVVQNALYWLEEYNLDGLRLDAVHAILDDSPEHLLEELARRARVEGSRPIHLLLENEENSAHWLSRDPSGGIFRYSGQWNDDVHHVLHVAATGEAHGYYADYVGQTEKLGRALAEGFAYQGETMPYSGRARGAPSGELPPTAFVAFIQNHDQVGNRAFGDRIANIASLRSARAIAAVYLLLPQIPMIFMGEEWGSKQPFPFFCDFHGALGEAVREGRRAEFSKFPEFQDEGSRQRIPDPQAESTFLSAKLRWQELEEPQHAAWLDFYRRILEARRKHIVPILTNIRRGGAYAVRGAGAVSVIWTLDCGGRLILHANLSNVSVGGFEQAIDGLIWKEGNGENGELSPGSVCWYVAAAGK